MATNDIYEIIDYQSMYGQQIENVYTFRRNSNVFVAVGAPNQATSLLDSWYSKVFPLIPPCQGTDLVHSRLTCRNLFDAADAADMAISVNGSANVGAVDDLPTYSAYSLTLNTIGLAVRDGHKRLAGVLESAQSDGAISNPTIALRLQQFANKLFEGIRFSADTPVNQVAALTIVKRVRSGTPGAYEYRLPENQGESVWADVAGVVFRWLLTSQVSRKIVGY